MDNYCVLYALYLNRLDSNSLIVYSSLNQAKSRRSVITIRINLSASAYPLSDFTVYALSDVHNPVESSMRDVCKVHAGAVTYEADGYTVMCDSPAIGRYESVLRVFC